MKPGYDLEHSMERPLKIHWKGLKSKSGMSETWQSGRCSQISPFEIIISQISKLNKKHPTCMQAHLNKGPVNKRYYRSEPQDLGSTVREIKKLPLTPGTPCRTRGRREGVAGSLNSPASELWAPCSGIAHEPGKKAEKWTDYSTMIKWASSQGHRDGSTYKNQLVWYTT